MIPCRHCKREIVPCPAPSMIPVCKGWKHAEFLDSMPVGAHYCGGRSVNPVAEPVTAASLNAEIRAGLEAAERGETLDLGSFAQYGSSEEEADAAAARDARASIEAGEAVVPWEQVKTEAGLTPADPSGNRRHSGVLSAFPRAAG
jgi:hypothetical protein